MRRLLLSWSMVVLAMMSFAQKNASVSFEKWISLKNIGGALISPDGRTIVYTVTSTDWTANNYDSELWMVRDNGAPVQLTRTAAGSSTNARFTPDGKFISFLADRGNKTQIWLISVFGGEAIPITKEEESIGNYEWSPDGTRIAFTRPDAESKKDKTTKERYGAFAVEGEDYRLSHLWLLHFHYDSVVLAGQVPCYTVKKDSAITNDSLNKLRAADCVSLPAPRRLTEGAYTVTRFVWNPDEKP